MTRLRRAWERRPGIERSFVLPATADAPRHARSALDGVVQGLLDDDRASAALLATSELVTNAVRHGGVSPADPIELSTKMKGGSLMVRVRQPTSTAGARIVLRSDLVDGGFGLLLVGRVSARWGIEPGPPGTVWFEV